MLPCADKYGDGRSSERSAEINQLRDNLKAKTAHTSFALMPQELKECIIAASVAELQGCLQEYRPVRGVGSAIRTILEHAYLKLDG